MPLNFLKDLSKSFKIFRVGSSIQTVIKKWYFISRIPILIFDAKQKYLNIMKIKL